MSKNDGGPAFPYSALQPDPQTRQLVGSIYADNVGMSLRDYFAVHAPPRPLWYKSAVYGEQRQSDELLPLEIEWRYVFADAMLAQREKE